MDFNELKAFLDFKAQEYETPAFIEEDPIQFPKHFTKKEDIEIIGFIMATISWGNRKNILKSGEKLLQIMQYEPYQYIQNYSSQKEFKFIHRTFQTADLDFFFRALNHIYQQGDLEHAFSKGEQTKDRIHGFRTLFLETTHENRSRKHLSDPLKNSACKRINMFLRWMTRSASRGVDLGIWDPKTIPQLMLPLDVHTSTVSRKLGLLERKQDDWKSLEELMQNLRKLDPNDPVKYDFALFGLGVNKAL